MESMASFTVEYFITDEGRKPFKEWLDQLRDIRARAKIRIRLDRALQGNLGDFRSVGQGVYELKINHGPGYRVYFAFEASRIILLLLGGDKSSQPEDIIRAKEYWLEHQKKRHAS